MRSKDDFDIAVDAFIADINQRAPTDFPGPSDIDDTKRDVLRHAMRRALAAWAMIRRPSDRYDPINWAGMTDVLLERSALNRIARVCQ